VSRRASCRAQQVRLPGSGACTRVGRTRVAPPRACGSAEIATPPALRDQSPGAPADQQITDRVDDQPAGVDVRAPTELWRSPGQQWLDNRPLLVGDRRVVGLAARARAHPAGWSPSPTDYQPRHAEPSTSSTTPSDAVRACVWGGARGGVAMYEPHARHIGEHRHVRYLPATDPALSAREAPRWGVVDDDKRQR
jgi:hypothetical protein